LTTPLKPPANPAISALRITILKGEGAIHKSKALTAREAVIEVRDQNYRSIAGAVVSFLLPKTGPGGTFSNGSYRKSVLTDARGRAIATGFRPNTVPGKFNINVMASFQGQSSTTVITQSNVMSASAAGASGVSARKIAVIAGAVAAVIAAVLTHLL
jgi:hypothetical protein